VVSCGKVWSGAVESGRARSSTAWLGMVRWATVGYGRAKIEKGGVGGAVWPGVVGYGMVGFGRVWCGSLWLGAV
jgi:hypothetical protein